MPTAPAGASEHGAFPTDPSGLPTSRAPDLMELADGDAVELRIVPVAKRLGDATVRLLTYNGSFPGPTLRVREGSEVGVEVVNDGDIETTVHWHGLRLDNRYDGTHLTQEPIPVGGRFGYRLSFPDPGVYWYHPHIRQDYGQDMGLYGTIVVIPVAADYWPPAHRELALALDDLLVEEGRAAPFLRSGATHTAMGRFGNVLLTGGEPAPALTARRGEVVRLYLTDTANTRVFNVGVRGARMKLVGGDSGRYEHERSVETVMLAPSERAVVDVLFDRPGEATLEHRAPDRTYPLASVSVGPGVARPSLDARFAELRTNADLAGERDRIGAYLDAPPDKVLAMVAVMDVGEAEGGTPTADVCSSHPEVVAEQADRRPRGGMPAAATEVVATAGGPDQHGGHDHERALGEAGGIEWEDDMPEMNRTTTTRNMRWLLVDRVTGRRGSEIDWVLQVGDQVKIRLVNELDSDHPMHHPFHIHGAGRFLILARDGLVEPNLVWKDTVLVPTGQTADLLLDVTHPGAWMAHCHISEHHEAGMAFGFTVVR